MQADILPLAITIMAGPQILADVIFVTSKHGAIKVSLSYLAGIFFAVSSFIAIVFIIARSLGLKENAAGHAPGWESGLEVLLVLLLIFMSWRSYHGRKTAKPPKWIGQLQSIKPFGAFRLAFPLVWLMPGDLIVMATIGIHLAANGSLPTDILNVLPFMSLVMLIAGFPLIGYLLFKSSAERAMPKIRDWMQSHSWLINIIIYIFFIFLIVT